MRCSVVDQGMRCRQSTARLIEDGTPADASRRSDPQSQDISSVPRQSGLTEAMARATRASQVARAAQAESQSFIQHAAHQSLSPPSHESFSGMSSSRKLLIFGSIGGISPPISPDALCRVVGPLFPFFLSP